MVLFLARFMRMSLVLVPTSDDAGRPNDQSENAPSVLRDDGPRKAVHPVRVRAGKRRNYQKWTPQDKRELRLHLKRLSRVSAYIALLIMPGGFAMLPIIAWWLDRRSSRRGAPQAQRHVTLIAQTHPSGQAMTK